MVKFKEVIAARKRGEKITESHLYEQSQCRDGSKFVVCKDHPQGPRTFRVWPKK